jgi:hypothetical protein
LVAINAERDHFGLLRGDRGKRISEAGKRPSNAMIGECLVAASRRQTPNRIHSCANADGGCTTSERRI